MNKNGGYNQLQAWHALLAQEREAFAQYAAAPDTRSSEKAFANSYVLKILEKVLKLDYTTREHYKLNSLAQAL